MVVSVHISSEAQCFHWGVSWDDRVTLSSGWHHLGDEGEGGES